MGTTNATAPKSAPKAKQQSKGFTGIKSGFAVIICCFVLAYAIYFLVFGQLSHFQAPDGGFGDKSWAFQVEEALDPITGDLIGTVYQGGLIVPVIWSLFLTTIALSIERFFALRNAFGKTSLSKFVANIKSALAQNDMVKAQQLCDAQRGSVANVVGATLATYREMENNSELDKEQKVLSIQKSLDEATALEMPMLQENLPIIATNITLGTLVGLLGTVVGMIRSFSAMGGEGGADSSALATGISEALVNTASGIATGAFSVISYNYFSNKIDRLTFALDEVGFSIVQTFNATH